MCQELPQASLSGVLVRKDGCSSLCKALPAPRDLVHGAVGEHHGGSARTALIRTLGDLKTWPGWYPALLQRGDGHLPFLHPLGEKKA